MTAKGKRVREAFLALVGLAVLGTEYGLNKQLSPLGVFFVLFIWGLIPAFRADEGTASGPLSTFVQLLAALGGRGQQAPPVDVLAEQEARAERAAQVARDRAAVRAALAEREAGEAPDSGTSPPGSSGPDSR